MAWIESHQTLINNGKLVMFAQRLGINKYQAIGHLHALWWWALDNAEDGNVKRFCNGVVTEVCGWSEYVIEQQCSHFLPSDWPKPNHDDFMKALIDCGFIDEIEEKMLIHGWEEYTWRYFQSIRNNRLAKEKTRERVRKFRDSNVTPMKRSCNADVTPMKRNVTCSTIPNLTIPNLTNNKGRYAPPTVEQVKAYCIERKNSVDPQRFVDFYSAKDWMIGKNKMKDWKACVRTWEAREPSKPEKKYL
jgi:hypothetical protein